MASRSSCNRGISRSINSIVPLSCHTRAFICFILFLFSDVMHKIYSPKKRFHLLSLPKYMAHVLTQDSQEIIFRRHSQTVRISIMSTWALYHRLRFSKRKSLRIIPSINETPIILRYSDNGSFRCANQFSTRFQGK